MSGNTAYHGYLIRTSISGMWIEKDGHLICWVTSMAEAKDIINDLLEGQ